MTLYEKADDILASIQLNCNKDNWDGAGSLAIKKEAIDVAKFLIHVAKDFIFTHMYPGINGDIILEGVHVLTNEKCMLKCYSMRDVFLYLVQG